MNNNLHIPLKEGLRVASGANVDDKPIVYIETYGCQMNVSDSEVVVAILQKQDYLVTNDINLADLILVNTCSIRDNAEQRIRGRLAEFRKLKNKKPALLIGVLGCMAERLKEQLLEEEKMVDIIAGPDSYRDLPNLVSSAGHGQKMANVLLSCEETYADISPVRIDGNGISAFISIMRGCNNMCAYCVVPYTRGAERSRNPHSILSEVNDLINNGYKEVTLLGQNVNSYNWLENGATLNFAQLMTQVARVSSTLRVRFATSHPKDISDELLQVIAEHPNICKSIHLPAQSGSSRILKLMNRKYDREQYLERITAINRIIPDCSISTDLIAGFCSETEDDYKQTLSLMREVQYDFAYMFIYSERPGTYAERHLKDDVDENIKSKRLTEIINLQSQLSSKTKKLDIGKVFEVLVEGKSKKKATEFFGRTSQNKVVVFPVLNALPGDYVNVQIDDCTTATLLGHIVK